MCLQQQLLSAIFFVRFRADRKSSLRSTARGADRAKRQHERKKILSVLVHSGTKTHKQERVDRGVIHTKQNRLLYAAGLTVADSVTEPAPRRGTCRVAAAERVATPPSTT